MPQPKRKGFMRWLLKKIGVSSKKSKVSFDEQASVYEFERQLLGGGGVPDGDAVALGLGPRCVNTYFSPLSDKEDKEEYASTGYLDAGQRTVLLSQWQPKPAVKAALDKARPEIEKLQRSRDECALSPRDQRYMPSNIGEAQLLAARDEEEAEAARRSSANALLRRSRATNTRGAAASQRVMSSPLSAHTASKLALGSPIQKRRL